MFRFIYTSVFYLSLPLVLLRLFYRSIREPGYRADIGQRFGTFTSRKPGELIWFHAVSAGETIAVAPLVRLLVEAGYPCLVTNMTPTGRERTRALLGETVENCYVPYDLPGAIRRFLQGNRPRMLVIVDTELWPNLLHEANAAGVCTALINGRLSARSARRYGNFPGATLDMLETLKLIAVQTASHAERFKALGAAPEQLHVTGSLKFDASPAMDHEEKTSRALSLAGGRPVLLAASTHAGEETAILDRLPDLQSEIPGILLVLAPRHTHRCDEVERLCQLRNQSLARLSAVTSQGLEVSVLMIDTMGELDAFFDIARMAFIGGSLVPVGGHNLLEAVRAHTPVIMGPHLDNIDDIAQQFVDADAMKVIADADELSAVLLEYLPDADKQEKLSAAADRVLAENRGALERTRQLLLEQLA